MGAWIEILHNIIKQWIEVVAPCVGAWIEINSVRNFNQEYVESHPVWVRGLKYL